MKYLKKYKILESKNGNKPIDPEYFNLVFADFIDEGATVEFDEGDDPSFPKEWVPYYDIFIEEPIIEDGGDIDKYIKSIDILKEKCLDIKSCINKIKDEFPNIDIDFDIESSGEIGLNNTKRDVHLTFSYKKKRLL